ncbi:MAG: AbrB/MazE/SpoVT family DNA-binding domain-containing protein [Terriglobia bacterium]|jgi:AbrB family looped-hinge helix DNA binding protein
MEITKLSSKGQVVLPKSVRVAKGWQPGTEFTVDEVKDGVILRPRRLFKPTTVEEVFGCLKYRGRPKTLKEMDEGITKEVKARHARGRY